LICTFYFLPYCPLTICSSSPSLASITVGLIAAEKKKKNKNSKVKMVRIVSKVSNKLMKESRALSLEQVDFVESICKNIFEHIF